MTSIAWTIGAVLLGVAALSVYAAFQSPTFVWGLAAAATVAAAKAALPVVTRRMPPRDEEAMRQAYRRGQGDEWLRKRQGSLKE